MTMGFAVAAALLSLERVCYVWIARAPDSFRRWCAGSILKYVGEPVAVVGVLFYAFKILQLSVFAAWCYEHGDGSLAPTNDGIATVAAATILMAVGQLLNGLVF